MCTKKNIIQINLKIKFEDFEIQNNWHDQLKQSDKQHRSLFQQILMPKQIYDKWNENKLFYLLLTFFTSPLHDPRGKHNPPPQKKKWGGGGGAYLAPPLTLNRVNQW